MKEQSNIFYYKINPIMIKNKCRPFLKICLKEPNYVQKLNNKSKVLNLKKTKFETHKDQPPVSPFVSGTQSDLLKN